ncbi:hypothetical protein ACI78V_09575 [Geodermatophilus sp. SYSU D00742]
MLSRPNHDLFRQVEGYMVNTGLSDRALGEIRRVQRLLSEVAPGLLWMTPPEALHITLLDWIAPLVPYDERRSELFARVRPQFDGCLRPLLESCPPIDVRFQQVVVGTDAIILRGTDDGTFGRIREDFVTGVMLHPQTKRPPRIVHTSIARYREVREIDELSAKADSIPLDLTERITSFRLVRENRIPMIDFDLLGTYQLAAAPELRAQPPVWTGGDGAVPAQSPWWPSPR